MFPVETARWKATVICKKICDRPWAMGHGHTFAIKQGNPQAARMTDSVSERHSELYKSGVLKEVRFFLT